MKPRPIPGVPYWLIDEVMLANQEQEQMYYYCFHCEAWVALHWESD